MHSGFIHVVIVNCYFLLPRIILLYDEPVSLSVHQLVEICVVPSFGLLKIKLL